MSAPDVPEAASVWPQDLSRTGMPERARDVVPRDVPVSRSEFRADLARAYAVWRRFPALPVLTTIVAVVGAIASSRSAAAPVAQFAALVLAGWVGAERLWYLRAYTGRRLTPRMALRSALSYWGRFVVLGLLVAVVFLPLTVPVVPAIIDASRAAQRSGAEVHFGPAVVVYLAAVSLLTDFLLTFVTPALVYTSKSAAQALVIGVTLLRRTWPATLPYVLLPPLAVLLLTRASHGPLGWVGGAVYVLASLLNLLAKGATAAYYLRVVPTAGPDGDTDHTAGWAGQRRPW